MEPSVPRPGPPPVRVGHDERERAVSALGEHYAQGRLDSGEYEERVGAAYAARTTHDIAVLFHDLPAPVPPRPMAHPPPARPDPSAPFGREPFSGRPYSDKSKIAAGVLQIFLGGLGIGRFYTGHTGMAIGQLIVTFLTFGFGAIWGFIDGIVILTGQPTDPWGRPLRPT